MIDEKYIELMNRSMDDLITDEEKSRLDFYLAENNEAKEYYEDLILTGKYLNEMGDPLPPVNLKKRILNSIDFSRYPGSTARDHKFKFSSIFNFKYAVSFAAGLLAGIFIYSLFVLNSDNISTEEVTGTIAATENASILEEIPLNFPGITGKIEMKALDQNFWLNIHSNSSAPVDFIISYPEQVHFENIKPGNPGDFQLSSGNNFIKATVTGSQLYSIMFKSTAHANVPLLLKLVQSGNKIYEHKFSLKK